jgi:hypothetical protein
MAKSKPRSTIMVADGAGGMKKMTDHRFKAGDWPISFGIPVEREQADLWLRYLAALAVSGVGTPTKANCSLFAGWRYQGNARFPLHSPTPRGHYCSHKAQKRAVGRGTRTMRSPLEPAYPAFQEGRETRQEAAGCVRRRWRGCQRVRREAQR